MSVQLYSSEPFTRIAGKQLRSERALNISKALYFNVSALFCVLPDAHTLFRNRHQLPILAATRKARTCDKTIIIRNSFRAAVNSFTIYLFLQ